MKGKDMRLFKSISFSLEEPNFSPSRSLGMQLRSDIAVKSWGSCHV